LRKRNKDQGGALYEEELHLEPSPGEQLIDVSLDHAGLS
jgi:hypothetical protein